jgi:hypothetical protein
LEILPLTKFTYNNSSSTTTDVTLFFANKGYHPNITIYPKCELASAKAHKYIVDLDELHTELHSEMAKAQARYQGPTDCCQEPTPNFQIGQQVFVRAENI